jgi:hypothetical protein
MAIDQLGEFFDDPRADLTILGGLFGCQAAFTRDSFRDGSRLGTSYAVIG